MMTALLITIIIGSFVLLFICVCALAEIASNSRRIREDVNDIKRLLSESVDVGDAEPGSPRTRYSFHVVK